MNTLTESEQAMYLSRFENLYNMARTTRRFVTFACLIMLLAHDSLAQNINHTPEVKHFVVPSQYDFHDWAWVGQSFVVATNRDDKAIVDILTANDGQLEPRKTVRTTEGRQPVALGSERFAYIKDGRILVVTSLSSMEQYTSHDLGNIGLIGEVSFAAGALWFHTIAEHSHTPRPQLYVFFLNPTELVTLGDGYYPTTVDGNTVYYVDQTNRFSLYSFVMNNRKRTSAEPTPILGSDVYSPQAVPNSLMLVCQRGVVNPRIELLTMEGRIVRCLSGDGRTAAWPLVSPSGKYVAYAHRQDGDHQATVVEIVDMDGNLIHQTLIGSHPITAGYRWSADSDRIAIMSARPDDSKYLDVISFPSN